MIDKHDSDAIMDIVLERSSIPEMEPITEPLPLGRYMSLGANDKGQLIATPGIIRYGKGEIFTVSPEGGLDGAIVYELEKPDNNINAIKFSCIAWSTEKYYVTLNEQLLAVCTTGGTAKTIYSFQPDDVIRFIKTDQNDDLILLVVSLTDETQKLYRYKVSENTMTFLAEQDFTLV